VLANEKITDANATFNSDLFVALKDGANNSEFVTLFKMKICFQGLLWGGTITYPGTNFPQLAAAFMQKLSNLRTSTLTKLRKLAIYILVN
jgi:hypothetical protein